MMRPTGDETCKVYGPQSLNDGFFGGGRRTLATGSRLPPNACDNQRCFFLVLVLSNKKNPARGGVYAETMATLGCLAAADPAQTGKGRAELPDGCRDRNGRDAVD